MLFYVTYEGIEHTVRVESRRNRLYVSFDENEEERLDLVYHGNDCSLIRNNRIFSANVVGHKQDYTVFTPERNLQFEVQSEYKRIVNKLRGQELEQENRITAKMPGKIAKVLTKVGNKVKQGEAVLVIEAMKMENEIRTTVAGTVKRIEVKEDQAVESGALLIELDTD